MTIQKQMPWRFEVSDPQRFTGWRPLWMFDENQLIASQELRDELNEMNAPIILRIVRDPG